MQRDVKHMSLIAALIAGGASAQVVTTKALVIGSDPIRSPSNSV